MYSAKKIENVKNSPGCWDSTKIGIYDVDNNEVGSFLRNYASYGETTFAPFKRGENWYALYSPDYESIRVLSLPDCKPIEMQDEKPGFCPVEIYIPQFQWRFTKGKPEEELKKYPEANHHWLRKDREEKEYDPELFNKDMSSDCNWIEKEKEIFFENFAFVSGCFWGDDSSWKVELFDISKAHEGIVKKVPEWGYYELPALPLRECVYLNAFERNVGETHDAINATITLTKTIRLKVEEEIKLQFFD